MFPNAFLYGRNIGLINLLQILFQILKKGGCLFLELRVNVGYFSLDGGGKYFHKIFFHTVLAING